jgi:hypothetical protein
MGKQITDIWFSLSACAVDSVEYGRLVLMHEYNLMFWGFFLPRGASPCGNKNTYAVCILLVNIKFICSSLKTVEMKSLAFLACFAASSNRVIRL